MSEKEIPVSRKEFEELKENFERIVTRVNNHNKTIFAVRGVLEEHSKSFERLTLTIRDLFYLIRQKEDKSLGP